MHKDIKPIKYYAGIFDKFKFENDIYKWDCFPETMWGLGYEMDCEKSFQDYCLINKVGLKEPKNLRDERKNNLYILEQKKTCRLLVGNYLFSHWRYWTHWSNGYEEHTADYLHRIIDILIKKYDNPLTIDDYSKYVSLPQMKLHFEDELNAYYTDSNLESNYTEKTIIVHENKMTNFFEVLESDNVFQILKKGNQ